MGAIGAYLSTFSGSFKAALLAWPLLSWILTLPILAFMYRRDGRLKIWSAIICYIAVLYIAGLAYFTFYPLPSGDSGLGFTYGIPPQLNPFNFISSIANNGLSAFFELLFNVILFIPLGFILKTFIKTGPWMTLAISFGVSLLIEVTQLTGIFGIYPFSYRTFDVNDLINNTLGGMIGWFLGKLIMKAFPQHTPEELTQTNNPSFIRRLVALWIDSMIMIIGTTFPYLIVSVIYELIFGDTFVLQGFTAAQTSAMFFSMCFIISFAIVEIVIPWKHGGSTFGGMFVRMTFETCQRTKSKRIAFYVARSVILFIAFAFPPYLLLLLALFYLIARKMPYDYIGDKKRSTP